MGGELCSAVVTAVTGPVPLFWPHLYGSSLLSDVTSHGPELSFL